MMELHRDGEPVEISTVATELRDNQRLSELGETPFAFLARISGCVATTATAETFIRQVRDLQRRRELLVAANRAAESCRDLAVELPDIVAGIEEQVRRHAETSGRWPEPVSAKALSLKPPPTPDVLIEGVLYRGGTMLISGPSKAHKTYTTLAAGCAVAHGANWLGFATTKTPVLYINLELQAFDTEKRVHQICQAMGEEQPETLHLWNLRGHTITLSWLRLQLPAKIRALGAGLVILDPHYKVSSVSGTEENSNDSQGQLLTAWEGLCGLNGAALLVAHHFAKGDASAKNAIDRASGGGVFARWGDVMLTFTPHQVEGAMSVEMALRNFPPVPPFAIRWEHPRWTRDFQLDPAKLKKAGAKQQYSPDEALEKLGTTLMGYSEWRTATGLSDTTFRRKRDQLLETGKIEAVGNLYRRRAA
jgi:hypothetical protein